MQTEINAQPRPRNRANNSNATESQQLAELRAENARLKTELEGIRRRCGTFLTDYAPEIEARRADYDRLGECLYFMTELEGDRVGSFLEVNSPYADSKGLLMTALLNHLRALCCESLDWFDRRTFQKFYTEMRLWSDHLDREDLQP